MEHASRLDLTRFEDPIVYDKMDRARVQGTDRVMMIQIERAAGSASDHYGQLWRPGFSFCRRGCFVVLVVCVVPAFLGETHFAFLGYSLNFSQTPRAARDGLLADRWRQQGKRQRTEAFWAGAVFRQPLHEDFRSSCMRRLWRWRERKLFVGTLLRCSERLGITERMRT